MTIYKSKMKLRDNQYFITYYFNTIDDEFYILQYSYIETSKEAYSGTIKYMRESDGYGLIKPYQLRGLEILNNYKDIKLIHNILRVIQDKKYDKKYRRKKVARETYELSNEILNELLEEV